jgi:hypothetical protein
MYERSKGGTKLYKTLLNHSKWHTALWTAVVNMQAAFQASNLEPGPTNKLGPQYQDLCADSEKLLDDLSAFFATQSLQQTPSFSADMSVLQKRAVAITARVKELAKGVSGNALAPHVRVKIREALAVRPFTQYQQKVVECLEKAAAISEKYKSDNYVQIAEGV